MTQKALHASVIPIVLLSAHKQQITANKPDSPYPTQNITATGNNFQGKEQTAVPEKLLRKAVHVSSQASSNAIQIDQGNCLN
jgi:hypothetical protein